MIQAYTSGKRSYSHTVFKDDGMIVYLFVDMNDECKKSFSELINLEKTARKFYMAVLISNDSAPKTFVAYADDCDNIVDIDTISTGVGVVNTFKECLEIKNNPPTGVTTDAVKQFITVADEMMDKDNTQKQAPPHYFAALFRILHEAGPSFSLETAQTLCYLGFFVSHNKFDPKESMHAWEGSFFYEDGANLTASGLINNPFDWMENGWYVKATPDRINFEKLNKMHNVNKGYMLSDQSYEDCISKTDNSAE